MLEDKRKWQTDFEQFVSKTRSHKLEGVLLRLEFGEDTTFTSLQISQAIVCRDLSFSSSKCFAIRFPHQGNVDGDRQIKVSFVFLLT